MIAREVSVRCVIGIAHVMLLQHPDAVLDNAAWIEYLIRMRAWCEAFKVRGQYVLCVESYDPVALPPMMPPGGLA